YLALDGIYRPIGAAFPNNPTRRQRLVVRQGPGTTGLSPSPVPHSRGLGPGPPLRTLLQATIRTAGPPDSKLGLFPRVIPPDLGSRSMHARQASARRGRGSPTRRGASSRQDSRSRLSTTTHRDVPRRGLAFGPAAPRGTGGQLPPPRTAGGGGDAIRDAQAGVPSA
ncbi:hypothetical protein ACH5RR_012925, partial [Cinchona calisaya]